MLRTTVVLIEYCALLDEGMFQLTRFPDPAGDLGTACKFAGYLDAARWYLDAFPSTLSDEQLNVPEMLPCPN
ncbi:MAG TPA: hypothetical protein VGF28_13080 [Thermoanaerobaculia bacterium]|jgi:hypothetical protein